MLDLSIVTGTYNRRTYLQSMIDSARRSCEGLTHEFVIVDGGSTDGTLEWCREQDDIVLIEQGELLGAIKAFNAGAFAAQGEFVALLNDDIEVVGDTLRRARGYLLNHPDVAQVAFRNVIKGTADKNRQPLSEAYGYRYGQCCMTRKHLGDLAGWWGDEGMRTYGGDTRLSLRLWELGYPTIDVEGCAIIDHVAEDELRKANNEGVRGPGNTHPDSVRFREVWDGRLPKHDQWIPAPSNYILSRAADGALRTLRFKAMMKADDKQRTAMIDAFRPFGPVHQVGHTALSTQADYRKYQQTVLREVERFHPDLILFQAQRPHKGVAIETVQQLKRRFPNTFMINWDGDTHNPLDPWHFEIAASVDLQLVVSPSLFPAYAEHGVNVGYWPIGIEKEYLEIARGSDRRYDIVFLGSLYGVGVFPEAETRKQAVLRLNRSKVKFGLFGSGWEWLNLKAGMSCEEHRRSAKIYTQAKMALSISQTAELWGYTSDRLYNITATGCPALVQRFSGMEEHGYVDGETCIVWTTLDEMVEKMRYYLNHPADLEEIGARGRAMTIERHTWEKRMNGLFAMIGGLTYG